MQTQTRPQAPATVVEAAPETIGKRELTDTGWPMKIHGEHGEQASVYVPGAGWTTYYWHGGPLAGYWSRAYAGRYAG